MTKIISAIALLICTLVNAQVYTLETIPNVKLINNSYVCNPDTILNNATVDQINQKLAALEAKTTVQVAVVIVHSIGGEDITEFAQQLFNRWGVGHPGKNNGLLILMVMDQRTIRFHTGYGLEGILPDIVCKHIEMERMVPYFKIEDYNNGMLDGVSEVVDVLTLPEYAQELYDDSRKLASGWNAFFWIFGGVWFFLMLLVFGIKAGLHHFAGSSKDKSIHYPALRPSSWNWLLVYWALPLISILGFDSLAGGFENPIIVYCIVLYGYLSLTLIWRRYRMRTVAEPLLKKENYYAATEFYQDQQTYWLVMAILFPLPWLPSYFLYKSKINAIRNTPRKCKSCQAMMEKLSEQTEDAYLKANQIFEEQIKSVDYDVWLCRSCGKQELFAYISQSKKYSACPKCKTKAFYNKGSRTVVSPTFTSTGTGETTQLCKYCQHTVVKSYSIDKLEPRSSSSSGSSSGSSSSSSGGSWGGGSSGGGGASSSW